MSIVLFVLMMFLFVGAAVGELLGGPWGAAVGALVALIVLVGAVFLLGRPPKDDGAAS